MAFFDPNDPAEWARWYDLDAEPDGRPNTRDGVRLHYHRAVLYEEARRRAAALVATLTLTTADTVAVVGGAYGWTAEALVADHGIDAIGVDTSSLVHNRKDTAETAEIEDAIRAAGLDPDTGRGAQLKGRLDDGGPRARVTVANEQLNNNGSRNRVRALFNSGRISWAVTEDMLPGLTDAEITSIAGNVGALPDLGVCHMVTPFRPETNQLPANWKTGADWRAFLIGLGRGGDVLILLDGSYTVEP